jgi:hypothetical protein
MDEHVKPSDLREQAARTRRLGEPSYGPRHGDWPDPFADPGELTPDELDLLQGHVPGHRWDGWRRLTGDEDYYAACSCGWRSPETGVMAEEIAWIHQGLETRHPGGSAGYQRLVGVASETAGTAREDTAGTGS